MKIQEVFIRVGTSLLRELNQPSLTKVLFVVISGNMLIQAVRDHEEWVGTYSVLSTCSPFQLGNVVHDMHDSLLR